MWFWPDTRKILVVDGHTENGNSHTGDWGCDESILTLPEGVTSTLRMIMQPDTVYIYVNDILACTEPRADRVVFALVPVYMSDPWYAAADASVENLYLAGSNADMVTPPPVGDQVMLGQDNWGPLVASTRIEDVTLPLDYEIGLDITPGALVDLSLIHI